MRQISEKQNGELITEQMIMLSARIYPVFRRIFRDYHPDEMAILHILRASGGEIKRGELIEKLGIDPRIVSKRIRDLLNMGLVDTYRSPDSARESIDKITEKGYEEFENLRKKIKLLLKGGFNFINNEQQKTLEGIVNQISKKINIIESVVKTMLCA